MKHFILFLSLFGLVGSGFTKAEILVEPNIQGQLGYERHEWRSRKPDIQIGVGGRLIAHRAAMLGVSGTFNGFALRNNTSFYTNLGQIGWQGHARWIQTPALLIGGYLSQEECFPYYWNTLLRDRKASSLKSIWSMGIDVMMLPAFSNLPYPLQMTLGGYYNTAASDAPRYKDLVAYEKGGAVLQVKGELVRQLKVGAKLYYRSHQGKTYSYPEKALKASEAVSLHHSGGLSMLMDYKLNAYNVFKGEAGWDAQRGWLLKLAVAMNMFVPATSSQSLQSYLREEMPTLRSPLLFVQEIGGERQSEEELGGMPLPTSDLINGIDPFDMENKGYYIPPKRLKGDGDMNRVSDIIRAKQWIGFYFDKMPEQATAWLSQAPHHINTHALLQQDPLAQKDLLHVIQYLQKLYNIPSDKASSNTTGEWMARSELASYEFTKVKVQNCRSRLDKAVSQFFIKRPINAFESLARLYDHPIASIHAGTLQALHYLRLYDSVLDKEIQKYRAQLECAVNTTIEDKQYSSDSEGSDDDNTHDRAHQDNFDKQKYQYRTQFNDLEKDLTQYQERLPAIIEILQSDTSNQAGLIDGLENLRVDHANNINNSLQFIETDKDESIPPDQIGTFMMRFKTWEERNIDENSEKASFLLERMHSYTILLEQISKLSGVITSLDKGKSTAEAQTVIEEAQQNLQRVLEDFMSPVLSEKHNKTPCSTIDLLEKLKIKATDKGETVLFTEISAQVATLRDHQSILTPREDKTHKPSIFSDWSWGAFGNHGLGTPNNDEGYGPLDGPVSASEASEASAASAASEASDMSDAPETRESNPLKIITRIPSIGQRTNSLQDPHIATQTGPSTAGSNPNSPVPLRSILKKTGYVPAVQAPPELNDITQAIQACKNWDDVKTTVFRRYAIDQLMVEEGLLEPKDAKWVYVVSHLSQAMQTDNDVLKLVGSSHNAIEELFLKDCIKKISGFSSIEEEPIAWIKLKPFMGNVERILVSQELCAPGTPWGMVIDSYQETTTKKPSTFKSLRREKDFVEPNVAQNAFNVDLCREWRVFLGKCFNDFFNAEQPEHFTVEKMLMKVKEELGLKVSDQFKNFRTEDLANRIDEKFKERSILSSVATKIGSATNNALCLQLGEAMSSKLKYLSKYRNLKHSLEHDIAALERSSSGKVTLENPKCGEVLFTVWCPKSSLKHYSSHNEKLEKIRAKLELSAGITDLQQLATFLHHKEEIDSQLLDAIIARCEINARRLKVLMLLASKESKNTSDTASILSRSSHRSHRRKRR